MHGITTGIEMVATDPNRFDVYWTIGERMKGIVRCTLDLSNDAPQSDKPIMAELSALQHLLEVANVLGHDRAGNNLSINVSAGAIKKLAKLKSEKKHLYDYSIFLATRFADAKIEVDAKKFWKASAADHEKRTSEIVITGPTPETIDIFGVGRVTLTIHAVDQFMARHCLENSAQAWRQLRNMASDPAIRRIKLPAQVEARKLIKHATEAIHMYHRGTYWWFVVVVEGTKYTLATCFERPAPKGEFFETPLSAPPDRIDA